MEKSGEDGYYCIPGAGRSTRCVPPSRPLRPGAVLSTQVSRSRYFFAGLTETNRGVIPAYGGFEECNPDYLIQREGFTFTSLELVVAGEGTAVLDGVEHSLRAGALFHYDHTTRIEIRTDPHRPMRKYFVCLSGAGARRRVREAGLAAGEVRRVARFAQLQQVWDDLIREGGRHEATTRRVCAALLEVLLLKVEELAAGGERAGSAAEDTYLRCKSAIETQAPRLGTLGDITRSVGVEATQLCRLFRRFQGTSPYQYLLNRKMVLAAERLMEPGALVKEAAGAVGFADPYHFSRCFKKVHRVAPREFQRSLRTG